MRFRIFLFFLQNLQLLGTVLGRVPRHDELNVWTVARVTHNAVLEPGFHAVERRHDHHGRLQHAVEPPILAVETVHGPGHVHREQQTLGRIALGADG